MIASCVIALLWLWIRSFSFASFFQIFNVDDFVAANMLAIEAYEPAPYPRRLTIFRAAGDRFDSKRALETGLGWASVAQAGFDLTDTPGDHLGILDPPNVETLGAKISELLRTLGAR